MTKEVSGVKRTTNKRKLKQLWKNYKKLRKKGQQKLYLSKNKRQEGYNLHKNQREKFKKAVRKVKAKSCEKFGENLEDNAAGNAENVSHIKGTQ